MAKKKKKKTPAYKTEAKKLSNAEFAGAIAEIEGNKATNERQYKEYVGQRQESLGKQIASDRLASQITGNAITGMRGEAMAEFERAATRREAARTLRDEAVSANNSNAVSNYEAQLRARGISGNLAERMRQDFAKQQGYTAELDRIDRERAGSFQEQTGMMYDTLKAQSGMLGTSAEAGARAQATEDFDEQYNQYLATRRGLETSLTKAKKDRGASYLNTYLTLKKEAQQRAAEKAQARLAAAAAMGRQASSDYFAQQRIDQGWARIDQSKNSALDRYQQQLDSGTRSWAKIWVDAKKNGVELPQWMIDQYAPKQKKQTFKYYDPRTGKYYGGKS